MKKGDLVKRVRFTDPMVRQTTGKRYEVLLESLSEYWKDPAVVVKGPYESIVASELPSGRPYSSVRTAVDLLYRGKVYENIFIDDVERIVVNQHLGDVE
jgi:hypothetical protein